MSFSLNLNTPAHYYPFAQAKYSTAPGLHKLSTDFGNGHADHQVFQIDSDWQNYRQNKEQCRQENIFKYHKTAQLHPIAYQQLCDFMIKQLLSEYPTIFSLEDQLGRSKLTNLLSQQTLSYDQRFQLLGNTDYHSLLDALADQIQEDLALWQKDGEDDWMSIIHLCAPNHWSPADKIGKPFSAVHQPVAGMEKMRQRYQAMLKSLIKSGPFVRFAWGLDTDQQLNHHPLPPSGIPKEDWQGRHFDPDHPALYVRVERQTLVGFPSAEAVLFTIRTYFEDVKELSSAYLTALSAALASMSEDSLTYKGLSRDYDHIQHYLQQLATERY